MKTFERLLLNHKPRTRPRTNLANSFYSAKHVIISQVVVLVNPKVSHDRKAATTKITVEAMMSYQLTLDLILLLDADETGLITWP